LAAAVAAGHDPYSAERARNFYDAQVLAMGAGVIAPEAAEKVLDYWLESEVQAACPPRRSRR
jgi:ribose 5-phosphate isomerase RpiB